MAPALRQAGQLAGAESAATVDSMIAKAMHDAAKSRQINTRLDDRPAARLNFLSGRAGLTLPEVQAYEQYRTTGSWGDGVAPLDPAKLALLNEAVALMGGQYAATGDSDIAQIMAGAKSSREADALNKALTGDQTAMAVLKASPIFEQNTDAVRLNRYSGDQSLDPGIAKTLADNDTSKTTSRPTADIQLIERLTLPADQGGVGYTEQEAFDWLMNYKRNPQAAMLNMYAKLSADNLFRPEGLKLTPEQIQQVVQETAAAFATSINEPAGATAPNYVWTPDGIIQNQTAPP